MESKNETCRNCGSSEFYTSHASFGGYASGALPLGAFAAARCRVRVCGGCGLAEWFLTAESLEKAKEVFEREPDAAPALDDSDFGRLDWNSEFKGWNGSHSALGHEYVLRVRTRSDTDRAITDEARRAFVRVSAHLAGIRQEAADEFLTDFNENWSPEEPFTRERLLQHLHLSGMVVEPDGYLEVEFSDRSKDDVFGGHVVVSRFFPDGTREVLLEG